jgi:dTDP-4-dehydrorhamnose 3,5-epimerase
VIYQTTDFYAPAWERVLLWNDTDLNIAWPLLDGQAPSLSVKDSVGKRLVEADLFNK